MLSVGPDGFRFYRKSVDIFPYWKIFLLELMVLGFKTSLDILPNWKNFQRINHIPSLTIRSSKKYPQVSSHQSTNRNTAALLPRGIQVVLRQVVWCKPMWITL
jgi:hypothetical protein